MEDRFLQIGIEFAAELARQENIKCDDELIKFCQEYKWLWFVAEMSDDYSRTLQEQEALTKRMNKYIKEHK